MVETVRCLLLAGITLLAGCTQWYHDLGTPLSGYPVPDLETPTSLSRVLADLGPPQRLSTTPAGYVLAWEYWQVRETSIGFSLSPLGVEGLGLDWGRAHAAGQFLLLAFDQQHRLLSSTFAQWDGEAGGGAAVQPFIGPVDVVDVGDLVRRMPQHQWGAQSMQRLPRALNAQSDPNSGHSGIEQRGTPTGVGQRSLEMR